MPLDCLSSTFPSAVSLLRVQLLSNVCCDFPDFAAKREAVPEQFRFGNAKDFGSSLSRCWRFSDRLRCVNRVKIAVIMGGQCLKSNNFSLKSKGSAMAQSLYCKGPQSWLGDRAGWIVVFIGWAIFEFSSSR